MLKRHTFWLKTAVIFLILTGGIHTVGLFVERPPGNESEKQLDSLMNTYHFQLDPYFSPTMADLLTALSSHFTWFYLFAATALIYLMRKKISNDILKGITGICVIFFGISFFVNLFLTFIFPIVLTGLCLVLLMTAYFLFPKTSE